MKNILGNVNTRFPGINRKIINKKKKSFESINILGKKINP